MSSSDRESTIFEDETPYEPGNHWRIIGLGAFVLVLVVERRIGRTNLVVLILTMGVASVIPMAVAVWAVHRRRTSVWSPAQFGMAGGAGPMFLILFAMVVLLGRYSVPGPSITTVLSISPVAIGLSALLGSIVGGVVGLVQDRLRSSEFKSDPSAFSSSSAPAHKVSEFEDIFA